MKVYHLLRNLKFGGCQTLALNIIELTPELNHCVIYLNEEKSNNESIKEYFRKICRETHFIDQASKGVNDISKEINSLFCCRESCRVISWFYPYSLKLNLIVPMIHHAGMAALDFPKKQWFKNNLIFFAARCKKNNDVIIYASKHIQRTHKKKYYFVPKNGVVVYNGINSNKMKYTRRDFKKIEKIIMAGRLDGSKDFDSYIKVAQIIGKQYPKIDFFIAGDGFDRSRVQKINAEYGEPVRFLGTVKRLSEKLNEYDVMIFLNKPIEGFGNVIVEAMYAGVLVISNNLGASKEIITHNRTGFLVDDFDHLVSTVKNVVEEDPCILMQVVDSAYEEAVKKFSAKTCASYYHYYLNF